MTIASCGCAHPKPGFYPQSLGWTQLEWRACPPDVPGSEHGDCALVDVPLDRRAPTGRVIQVFCRRFRPDGPIRGQLWALDGGPGEAGDGFVAPQFRQPVLDAGYELIVPSHRGSAYGTTLACPQAHDEVSCFAELLGIWGTDLAHFDTHAAALDVQTLAAGYPAGEGQHTLMFGGSYGTVWGQRVLNVAPDRFDGAYFDSLGDLGMNFETIGRWTDRVGRAVLERCAHVAACDQRFPSGVLAAVSRVDIAFAEGRECTTHLGISRDSVQALFMRLLDGVEERALIAPLLQRLDRCDALDREDLKRAFAHREPASQQRPAPPPRYNPLLNLVVIYREQYRVTLDTVQLDTLGRQLLFDDGAMAMHHQRRQHFPPDFARPIDLATGSYRGDLHLVQGELDPRSPPNVIDQVGARWPLARRHTLVLPDGGHASPRFSGRHDGERCSTRWLVSFLADPTRDFDASCLDDVPSIDLTGARPETKSLAQQRLGWHDVWRDPSGQTDASHLRAMQSVDDDG